MRTSDHEEFTREGADDLRPKSHHFIFELSFILGLLLYVCLIYYRSFFCFYPHLKELLFVTLRYTFIFYLAIIFWLLKAPSSSFWGGVGSENLAPASASIAFHFGGSFNGISYGVNFGRQLDL
ncbi:hypothetical protein KFK09_005941 [Dendrobium nobile]|uniref:Uncharacterized protein n=1 Tax=Dendrobium nobile TaxID=94219 RepID=A0A8T3C2T4_DENNO|nr:hypothetical protein KFK09_005941 [Dendrobium nobile]